MVLLEVQEGTIEIQDRRYLGQLGITAVSIPGSVESIGR